VGEDGLTQPRRAGWRRRAAIALAIFSALLLLFHRPVLLSLGHALVLHFAKKENLKLEFRLEGSVFTNLTVRDFHAVATGPSDVESIDVDLARFHYGLFSLIRGHFSTALKDVEARNARIVLNPAKTSLRPRPPDPKKKIEIPDIFPERLQATDVTVIVRNRPHDFVAEHVDLELNPRSVGALKVGSLQLVGGQTWSNLSSLTSYENRKLVLREIALANDERIRSFIADASKIGSHKLEINFEYVAGSGTILGALALREASSTLDAKVHLTGAKVSLDALNKFFALPEGWMRGDVEKVDVDLSGLLSSPQTWTGKATAQINNFRQEGLTFDASTFQVVAENGSAFLRTGDIAQGQNEFHLRGSMQLPHDIREFGRDPATLEITARAPDLRAATSNRLGGSGEANGKIDIVNRQLNGAFTLAADSLVWNDGAAEKISGTATVSKKMPAANSNEPWFANLKSETKLTVTNGRVRDLGFDSGEFTLRGLGDVMTIERSIVRRKENEFVVSGEYRLPKNPGDAANQPAKIDMALNAVQLGDYWVRESADKLTGPLQVSGQIEMRNGVANGQLSIFGANVRMRDLVFEFVSGQCTVANSVIYLNDFTAKLNEHDYIRANAIVDLRAPFAYRGKVAANIDDLSVFEPVLRAAGNQNALGGSLLLDWEGSGEAKTFRNSGTLRLILDDGRWADADSLQANVQADYSPDELDVPIIFIGSDKMDFQAIAHAEGETLEITKVQLDQGQARYASGFISVPFVWKNLGSDAPVAPSNGKVAINFQSENLDLRKLFEDFGMKAPASGTVNLNVNAQGTLAKLDGRADLHMRDVRTADLQKLEPAAFDLVASVQNNQLNVTGTLQQAKIQPLEMTGNIPFDAAAIVRAHGLPDDTRVQGKLRLPRTSVNFIRQFAPDLAQIDGEAGLDVDLAGTIANPVLTGAGDISINTARALNTTFPALQNFKARVIFERDTLTLQQFGGELSGGKFSVSGGVHFPKLTNPIVDLAIKSESALVARNDTVTARVDADLKINGPFNAATVTGTVSSTNSQFLKNIDLLPIGLPGRPPPQAPSARPDFSFPAPPFRDWKFDVAIKTKDPFRIRGNMAKGGAIADLHLIGTGLHPGIEGMVRMENVEATLPFSRLEVSYGYLSFDPSDSFNPKIELHGTSVIRDYIIHVYVYGTALAPEAIFTSEPPLPQEEVISLLATGTTREELTGNNNVLAGRAATLLVQQLYRKVFKKGGETETNSVFDRLDLDVGQTDPRTGQRQATARFKVNDQFVLLGDLDVAGGFKGMVKYLIRFR
jgi:hypothetical protein